MAPAFMRVSIKYNILYILRQTGPRGSITTGAHTQEKRGAERPYVKRWCMSLVMNIQMERRRPATRSPNGVRSTQIPFIYFSAVWAGGLYWRTERVTREHRQHFGRCERRNEPAAPWIDRNRSRECRIWEHLIYRSINVIISDNITFLANNIREKSISQVNGAQCASPAITMNARQRGGGGGGQRAAGIAIRPVCARVCVKTGNKLKGWTNVKDATRYLQLWDVRNIPNAHEHQTWKRCWGRRRGWEGSYRGHDICRDRRTPENTVISQFSFGLFDQIK